MDYQGDAAFERTTDARRADDGRRAKRRASRVCRCDATRCLPLGRTSDLLTVITRDPLTSSQFRSIAAVGFE